LRVPDSALAPIYGEFFGGFILPNVLKVATLSNERIWGLYPIDELRDLAPVRRALGLESGINFFMDSANVWYYGVKRSYLYCYDREFDELYSMGSVEDGINELIDQWLEAKAKRGDVA
jgi:hypothetical protein